ncbi:MAG: hypothetical protein RL662_1630 [Bacteroidota bacterium]|jgi:phage shock protein PspC (stress-responsive transcriptional regulator)
MKKVIEVNIGGVNFTIEDDAYIKLKTYLSAFEASLPNKEDRAEIMEDVENRVAELFQKDIKYPNQVVNLQSVDYAISCLGEIDTNTTTQTESKMKTEKKLYRNADDKKIAGVCSGLASYLNIDETLIRVLFVVLLFGYGSAFVAYIVLWIVMPEAKTVIQKLEMRGEPVTADNIRIYTNSEFKK